MKKCSSCGKDILDDIIRCPYCGIRQERQESDSTVENSDRQKTEIQETLLDEKIKNIEKISKR